MPTIQPPAFVNKYLQSLTNLGKRPIATGVYFGQLQVTNSDNSHIFLFQGSQTLSDINVVIPPMSGDDTMVMQNMSQILTNKDLTDPSNIIGINVSANALTADNTQPGDILISDGKKFNPIGIGTAGQVLTVTPTSNGVLWQNIGAALSNLSLPSDYALSTSAGYWKPSAYATAGIDALGMISSPTLTGTAPILVAGAAASTINNNGPPVIVQATGAGTVHGGINMLRTVTQRSKNCRARFQFAFTSGTSSNSRMWMGLLTDTANPIANASNPLNSKSGVVFGFQRNGTDTGATGHWTIGSNNGGVNMTFNDTGIVVDSAIHTVTIQANDSAPNFVVTFDNNAPVTLTATIPASTTALNFFYEVQNPGTTTTQSTLYFADLTG